MNPFQRTFVAAACLGALAFGCRDRDQKPKATEPMGSSTVTSQRVASPSTSAELTTSLVADDKKFLEKAAQGGKLEVVLGQDVAKRGASKDVKDFANEMVTDHGKANKELEAIAAKKGATVPPHLDEDHQKVVDKLAKLDGAKLDKEYADDMVDDHEKDVKEFKDAAKDVKDPDLRAWASKTVPILETHLAHAKEMKAKTK